MQEPDRAFKFYTSEIDGWLPRFVELVVPEAGPQRLQQFLEAFDLNTLGGREVLNTLSKATKMTAEECQKVFASDAAKKEKLAKANLHEQQWEVAKYLLRRLLPSETLYDAEMQLAQITRDPSCESQMDYCLRFHRAAGRYIKEGKLDIRQGVRLLYVRLPRLVQKSVTHLPYKTVTMDELMQAALNVMHWVALSLTEKSPPGELDRKLEETPVGPVVEGDLIHYDRISDAESSMIVWKKLIESPKYFKESLRFLQGAKSPKGKKPW